MAGNKTDSTLLCPVYTVCRMYIYIPTLYMDSILWVVYMFQDTDTTLITLAHSSASYAVDKAVDSKSCSTVCVMLSDQTGISNSTHSI